MIDIISQAIEAASASLPKMGCRLGEPMKNHTSFKIGGPVRAMFFPENGEELAQLCSVLQGFMIEPLIMGNGTNLLVDDKPLELIAIKTTRFCSIERKGETDIIAGAGVLLSKLAVFAYECELTGLEFAHGIPGTLGGGVTMNAGAYDGEMKDIIRTTTAYSSKNRKYTVTGEEHDFSYRRSVFHGTGDVVLSSVISLRKADKESIKAKMNELDTRRREKQPLELPSAGSTFKRPKGGYAAALIEQAGMKGYTVGGAQVSEKHSGFVVNRGGASFADVITVIEHIRETVLKQFGVELELEIKIIKAD